MENNLTALICCFSRAYHYKNNEIRIFSDSVAMKLLSDEEYNSIASNMVNGIKLFNPSFVGTKEEALRWIVDKQLFPSILGRQAFCEKSLAMARRLGCKQYLILASGYDTFAYRNDISDLSVFEIDKDEMIFDKINRLKKNNIYYSNVNFIRCDFSRINWIDCIITSSYDQSKRAFCSLLGIVYYLKKEEFFLMLQSLSKILCSGSSIVFDYPIYDQGKEAKNNEALAYEADEQMKSKYSYQEMEEILSENGFLIYEHLDDEEMNDVYFAQYNTINSENRIVAPKGVCYCLAVKAKFSKANK